MPAGSQLIVAQRGIDDFLFAQSAFPEATMRQVSHLPGAASVNPVVGVNGVVSVRGTHLLVYLVGLPGAAWGAPGSSMAVRSSRTAQRSYSIEALPGSPAFTSAIR